MELPTYTSIWRIEKRLYKLYDFRLPMPLPVGQIVVFTAITVPYVLLLTLFGLPINHTLFWLYVLPPGVLTWLATRPVLESKRLPELVLSHVRYLAEPSTWCRMAPMAEPDEVVVVVRVWRRVGVSRARVRSAAPDPAAAGVAAADLAGAKATTAGSVPAAKARSAPARGWASRRGRRQATAPPVSRGRVPAEPTGVRGGGPLTGSPRSPAAAPTPTRAGARASRAADRLPGARPAWAAAPPSGSQAERGSAMPSGGRAARAVAPPAGGTGGPAAGAGAPAVGTSQPGVGVGVPAAGADGPVAGADAPAGRSSGPAEGTGSLVAGISRSAAGAAQPATASAGANTTESSTPVLEADVPEAGSGDPAGAEASAADASAPAVGSSAPAGDASAPAVERAPAGDASAPAVGSSAPAGDASAPAAVTGAEAEASGPGKEDAATPPSSAGAEPGQAPDRGDSDGARDDRGDGRQSAGAPPVVVVPARRASARPAPLRSARAVERALGGRASERSVSWRDRVTVVPGGRGPARPDFEHRDAARAVLPLEGPRLVMVLGCTVGAGQTVSTLMLADVLANLRAQPVAAVDINPGPASLTQQARTPAITSSALLAAGLPVPAAQRARSRGRLDVILDDATTHDATLPDPGRLATMFHLLAARYQLTLADPGAAAVSRVLEIADQLVLVAPASPDAARALAMTREWLGANGHETLAAESVTVINGVSKRSLPHAQQAELVARGRCRAIVRIPWDDHLAEPEGERAIRDSRVAAGASSRAGQLRPPVRQAYTALAGVLVAALAAGPQRRKVAR